LNDVLFIKHKQGGHVTLMWLAALSSAILMLWCGCMALWRIFQHLKVFQTGQSLNGHSSAQMPHLEYNACHDKSIRNFLTCVFIDVGVRVCVWLWRGFKFSAS